MLVSKVLLHSEEGKAWGCAARVKPMQDEEKVEEEEEVEQRGKEEVALFAAVGRGTT